MMDRLMDLWDRMMRAAMRLAARDGWRTSQQMRARWNKWRDRQLQVYAGLPAFEDRDIVIAD